MCTDSHGTLVLLAQVWAPGYKFNTLIYDEEQSAPSTPLYELQDVYLVVGTVLDYQVGVQDTCGFLPSVVQFLSLAIHPRSTGALAKEGMYGTRCYGIWYQAISCMQFCRCQGCKC